MTAQISIVVPVRNQFALTRECVTGLTSMLGGRDDVEIVVVDDGSTGETSEFLEQADVRVVRHDRSTGFAASCNDGAAVGSSEYLVFLNNDTVGEAGWLDALVAYARANEHASVVGAKLLYPNRTIQHAGIVVGADLLPRHVYRGFPEDHPAVNRARRFQAVTAACMLVRRDVFDEVGGFDSLFLNGFDDIDLCLRVGERGGETHYCPESTLTHLEAATRGEDDALFRLNLDRYRERWGDRIRRDDFEIYAADGLIEVLPGDLYPLEVRVDPLLATVAGGDVYDVLEERSRQVFALLKENARLRIRLMDAGLADLTSKVE